MQAGRVAAVRTELVAGFVERDEAAEVDDEMVALAERDHRRALLGEDGAELLLCDVSRDARRATVTEDERRLAREVGEAQRSLLAVDASLQDRVLQVDRVVAGRDGAAELHDDVCGGLRHADDAEARRRVRGGELGVQRRLTTALDAGEHDDEVAQ
eukprot:SAG11_NODE_241_length_11781_cov_8.401900_3_plen_156_part_00